MSYSEKLKCIAISEAKLTHNHSLSVDASMMASKTAQSLVNPLLSIA